MSGEEYILKEEKLIEKAYRNKRIMPEAWISKNAEAFNRKYVKSINPVCRPWFTYVNKNHEGG